MFFLAALGGGTVLAALAIVAGVALVATAFVGGARWLIVPALVLVLPLAIVAAADIDVKGGVGERSYRPTTMAEVRDPDTVSAWASSSSTCATSTCPPAGPTSSWTSASAARSSACPTTRACRPTSRSAPAHAHVLDRDNDGVDVAYARPAHARRRTRPQVHVNADIGVGALEVAPRRRGPD